MFKVGGVVGNVWFVLMWFVIKRPNVRPERVNWYGFFKPSRSRRPGRFIHDLEGLHDPLAIAQHGQHIKYHRKPADGPQAMA